LVDIVNPYAEAGPRKGKRQRQSDMPATTHHANVQPKLAHLTTTRPVNPICLPHTFLRLGAIIIQMKNALRSLSME
jgi:hypothetical protein